MFPITFTFFFSDFWHFLHSHLSNSRVVLSGSYREFVFVSVFCLFFELKRENLKPANRLNRRRGSSVSFVLALTILPVLCGFFSPLLIAKCLSKTLFAFLDLNYRYIYRYIEFYADEIIVEDLLRIESEEMLSDLKSECDLRTESE